MIIGSSLSVVVSFRMQLTLSDWAADCLEVESVYGSMEDVVVCFLTFP
jgi:hypothetical protein